MALRDRLQKAVDALLGRSAYEVDRKGYGRDLDDEQVIEIRERLGGQLQPIPTTNLRWYLADLEQAQFNADAGSLIQAARLWNAMRRDGYLWGLMNTRCDGLVRLPKRFYGDITIGDELGAQNGPRSVFDEMIPPSELGLVNSDGIALGVAVAENVPVSGREYPVMVRLDPEFLTYRWAENRWYYASIAGLLPITPGDGRWVLHTPGGRVAPWRYGQWPALGLNYIEKSHAIMHRANFSAKLANPARVAYAPAGATENFRKGFMAMLMSWGINSVFEMPPGWQAALLEIKGEGWKVFQDQIDACNKEYMILIAGQEVTTTGGTGFSNQKMPEMIRQDIIAADAEKLGYTVNTQLLPVYTVIRNGESGLDNPTWMRWATERVEDMKEIGQTLQTAAQGIAQLAELYARAGISVDLRRLAARFGIPLSDDPPPAGLLPAAPAPAARPKPPTESTPEGKALADKYLADPDFRIKEAA